MVVNPALVLEARVVQLFGPIQSWSETFYNRTYYQACMQLGFWPAFLVYKDREFINKLRYMKEFVPRKTLSTWIDLLQSGR